MEDSNDYTFVTNIPAALRSSQSQTIRRNIKLRSGIPSGSTFIKKSILYILMLLYITSTVHGEENEDPPGWFQTLRSGYYAVKSYSCRVVGRECCLPPFINTETAVSGKT